MIIHRPTGRDTDGHLHHSIYIMVDQHFKVKAISNPRVRRRKASPCLTGTQKYDKTL